MNSTTLLYAYLWVLPTRVAKSEHGIYLARLRIQPYRPLVTVLEAILTGRQPREKLRCLYDNLMWSNFRKTAVLIAN